MSGVTVYRQPGCTSCLNVRELLRVLAAVAACICGAAQGETVVLLQPAARTLDYVDPGSGLRLASLPLPAVPMDIVVAPDDRRAVVVFADSTGGRGATFAIATLDHPSLHRPVTAAVDGNVTGIAWSRGGRAALILAGAGRLWLVDPRDGRVLHEQATTASGRIRITVIPGTSHAYLAETATGRISGLDLESGTRLLDWQATSGIQDVSVTPDGHLLWVAQRVPAELVLLDVATMQPARRIVMPGEPLRVTVAADGRHAYVLCAMGARRVLLQLDTRSFATQETAVQNLDTDATGLAATATLPRATCHACTPTPDSAAE